MKSEVRILLSKEFTPTCLNDKMTLYLIIRGVKGIEHVGLLRGGFKELLNKLRESKVLDEVRIILSNDFTPETSGTEGDADISKAIANGHLIMGKLIEEINKLICRNSTS